MRSSTLALGLVLCCFHFASAQPNVNAPHHEQLKELDYLVGTWKGNFDPPGSVPEGTVTLKCHWICHKTYLNIECTFVPNGADIVLNSFNLIIGYNGKTKSPHAWQLGLNGQLQMVVQLKEDGLKMEGKGDGIDGLSISQTVEYEFRSQDELITRTSGRTRNGEKLPQEDPIVFHRVRAD